MRHPASEFPFLELRVERLDLAPTLRGVCVGYENGRWRASELARHMIEWLPDFALDAAERHSLGLHNMIQLAGKAAASIYTSDKYKNRGEFGELLLHIVLRQMCNTVPAISKLYFKSSANETVKGFDAVHVVGPAEDLELWLGEVKFYTDVADAVREVCEELALHVEADYLRQEFIWIGNKIGDDDEHATALRGLLNRNVSLDKVFARLCFPVLLTYESECIASHSACDAAYLAAFEQELGKIHEKVVARELPTKLRVHLFLIPLHQKVALVKELDERLKSCQRM